MVTVICEKTGVAFEAATKRTRNHPDIMGWLNAAYKDGWYSAAFATIKEGREAGWSSIDQFIAALRKAEYDAKEAASVANKARAEQEMAARNARRSRHITNDLLRGRGYKWHRYENDEEDIDFLGVPAVEYSLISPDGRSVTVQEAMIELAWTGVKFAKEWLASHNIAEEVPAIEKQRQASQAQAEEEQRKAELLDAESVAYMQEAEQALIGAGIPEKDAHSIALRWSGPHTPSSGTIPLGPEQTLQDGRHIHLAFCDDLRYGVMLDGKWCGITSVLEMPGIPQAFKEQLLQRQESK